MFFYKNDIKNGLSNERLKNLCLLKVLVLCMKMWKRKKLLLFSGYFWIKRKRTFTKSCNAFKSWLDVWNGLWIYRASRINGILLCKTCKKDELVYTSLKEQYLPDGEDSELPSNLFSSIVALSNKLDNLMGLFSVGKIPTGSKDHLHWRKSSWNCKIAMEHKLSIDLSKIIDELSYNYKNLDKKVLVEFFNERLFKIFEVNPTV